MRSNQVTIKDIARLLKVAPSTVSRALKDHPDISQETKDAVKQLAEKLNYQPNAVALSLRQSKTKSIGVVVPEIVHFYFSTVISGIEEVAHDMGYQVLISQSNELFEREKDNCKTLFDSRVDGFLICVSKYTTNYDHIHALMDKGFPVVLFDRPIENMDCSSVNVDDVKGGYIATKHLIDQGCKRVAHISGLSNMSNIHARHEGYKKAMSDHGMDTDGLILEVDYPVNTAEKRDALVNLLTKTKPDGVFVHNDMIAVELLQIAKELNVDVPSQVKVVGFSNWFFTEYTTPSLSTIEQKGFQIGKHAAQLLLEEIKENEKEDGFIEPKHINLDPELVVRASSSC